MDIAFELMINEEIRDREVRLIDENGEALTECDYTYIRVLNDAQIELGKRDGTRLTVDIEG